MRLMYRGDYLPPVERKALHNAVRAAAGNRCIRCGHPNETATQRAPCSDRCTHPRNDKQRVLTVHHLDGDKANNRWWNLLALCQVCHLQIQGKVVPERPYLWTHAPWMVPYVCGFYASYYGQLEISRADAEADPMRWLLLGQPWHATEAAR